MTRPFFSIVVTTHLRAAVLRRSLSSILDQTFSDHEIIVVADAMDVGTGQVVAELLRPQDYFFKRAGKPGPADSRNEGMRLAGGEWVVFLDDDDSLKPEHLQNLHEAIQARPEALALYSDFEVVYENRGEAGIEMGQRNAISLGHFDPGTLWVKNFIPNNALAFKHRVLDGCRVDPHLASQEDWDFLLAVCARSMPLHYVGGAAVVHKDVNPGTRRGTQASSNDSTVLQDFLHIYRRWPAPTPALKAQRAEMLSKVGLSFPAEWF